MAVTSLTVRGRAPTCGVFSKAVPGSVAVNFGNSAGRNCSRDCAWYNNGCYSQRVESRPDRVELAAKLERHEHTRADHILSRALTELDNRKAPPPWFRISSAGSVPPNPSPALARQWRRMGDYIIGNGLRDRHHIPVETMQKAARYRALDRRLTIRESAQTWHRWIHGRGAMSTVIGAPGTPLLQRIDQARAAVAARRDATGRPGGVCPAVMQSFRQRMWTAGKTGAKKRGAAWTHPKPQSAKCGDCRLCALPSYDVVYPFHG